MKLILKENIPSLGKIGDIVEVSDGYARNYLIPNGLAQVATLQAIKQLEIEREQLLKKEEKNHKEAIEISKKLLGLVLKIPVRVGIKNKIHGAVTSKDIFLALKKEGINLKPKSIYLPQPIKLLGKYKIPIKLSPAVTSEIYVEIVPLNSK